MRPRICRTNLRLTPPRVYALVPGRWAAEDVFSATAARTSACNAFSSASHFHQGPRCRICLSRVLSSCMTLYQEIRAAGKAMHSKALQATTHLDFDPLRIAKRMTLPFAGRTQRGVEQEYQDVV
jgi:hypothetical protein